MKYTNICSNCIYFEKAPCDCGWGWCTNRNTYEIELANGCDYGEPLDGVWGLEDIDEDKLYQEEKDAAYMY